MEDEASVLPETILKMKEGKKKKKKGRKGDLFKKSSVASVILLNKYLANLKLPETVSWGEGCGIRRTGTVIPQNPYLIQTKTSTPCLPKQSCFSLLLCH